MKNRLSILAIFIAILSISTFYACTEMHQEIQPEDIYGLDNSEVQLDFKNTKSSFRTNDWTKLDDINLPPGTVYEFLSESKVQYRLPDGWAMASLDENGQQLLKSGDNWTAECLCQDQGKCGIVYNQGTDKISCVEKDGCQECKLEKKSLDKRIRVVGPINLAAGLQFDLSTEQIGNKATPSLALLQLPIVQKAVAELNQQIYGGEKPNNLLDENGNLAPGYRAAAVDLFGYKAGIAVPISYDANEKGGIVTVSCECSLDNWSEPGFCYMIEGGGITICDPIGGCSVCKMTKRSGS